MDTVIVVATNNGSHHLRRLLVSLDAVRNTYPVMIVDTGSTEKEHLQYLEELSDRPAYSVNFIQGGWSTGAYIWAYRQLPAAKHFLFLHDSTEVKSADFMDEFHRRLYENTGEHEVGVVPFLTFDLFFDTGEQRNRIAEQYESDDFPSKGIFGPIFYTSRFYLDALAENDLLPEPATNRMEEQGNERAWAMAFHLAGFAKNPIGHYDHGTILGDGYPVLRKYLPVRG